MRVADVYPSRILMTCVLTLFGYTALGKTYLLSIHRLRTHHRCITSQDDGVVQVYLLYDHERDSTNRAAGHWHFKVEGKPNTYVRLVLNNFYNVWNGTPGFPISEKSITYFSYDQSNWSSANATLLEGKDRVQIDAPVGKDGFVYVARLPPYRISDLDNLLHRITNHPKYLPPCRQNGAGQAARDYSHWKRIGSACDFHTCTSSPLGAWRELGYRGIDRRTSR